MNAPAPIASLGQASAAYRDASAAAGGDVAAGGNDFSALLNHAVSGAIAAGQEADTKAANAISGQGDLTDVVTAVSRAELALQTTVAIRDRVLQAYQDIIKMPI